MVDSIILVGSSNWHSIIPGVVWPIIKGLRCVFKITLA